MSKLSVIFLSCFFNNLRFFHSANTDSPISSIIINDVAKKEDQLTYAKVVALKPALNNAIEINENVSNETPGNFSNSQQKNSEINNNSGISAEFFVGVERRRNKTKRLFLSGIASNVNENNIQSYLKWRCINPTYISVLPRRRKGSASAKMHIPSAALPLVHDGEFWPRFVTCKLWKSNEKMDKIVKVTPRPKASQCGNLSTYV